MNSFYKRVYESSEKKKLFLLILVSLEVKKRNRCLRKNKNRVGIGATH